MKGTTLGPTRLRGLTGLLCGLHCLVCKGGNMSLIYPKGLL